MKKPTTGTLSSKMTTCSKNFLYGLILQFGRRPFTKEMVIQKARIEGFSDDSIEYALNELCETQIIIERESYYYINGMPRRLGCQIEWPQGSALGSIAQWLGQVSLGGAYIPRSLTVQEHHFPKSAWYIRVFCLFETLVHLHIAKHAPRICDHCAPVYHW